MKVTEHIQQANGNTLFSFEILPPKKGYKIQTILNHVEPLLQYNPSFIDVTYHREEIIYNEQADGHITKHILNKRPGTLGTCSILQHKFGVDAIPHILCGGFSKTDTENMLIDLDFIGIDNVMALRGDTAAGEVYFTPYPDGHQHANQLVAQINNLKHGKYVSPIIEANHDINFEIGVAGYPEKHIEAPNLQQDLKYLKKKIDAGAAYIVTQMFFDNQVYFDFVDKCRAYGITVPIIPGIKPFSHAKQLSIIPHRFNVDLPQKLIEAIEDAKTPTEIKNIGIKHCIHQCIELLEHQVPVLHFYSMGKSKEIEQIIQEVL